ncbi:Serine/threonine-protein kinase MARK2 [Fasciola gigantica]|uniref:Serine/threonine-protein kinase MARK2 n=1 Tax=Fasciola gigantica TaxID=46835 RepID=A0A504YKQ3_FASGI|nr:Serine/threonine-protein kinase MARK2 [Fasciola gigantica]
MSTDCESLLKKMLVLNPDKRYSLEAVMKDRWINTGYEDNPLTPYVEPEPDYTDPVRIEIMVSMGFNRDEIMQSLKASAMWLLVRSSVYTLSISLVPPHRTRMPIIVLYPNRVASSKTNDNNGKPCLPQIDPVVGDLIRASDRPSSRGRLSGLVASSACLLRADPQPSDAVSPPVCGVVVGLAAYPNVAGQRASLDSGGWEGPQ